MPADALHPWGYQRRRRNAAFLAELAPSDAEFSFKPPQLSFRNTACGRPSSSIMRGNFSKKSSARSGRQIPCPAAPAQTCFGAQSDLDRVASRGQANEVYLTTGLDLTTSPVSDIYLTQIELDSDPPGLEISARRPVAVPEAALRANGRAFRFALTLPRFEFLCRVADGAMPSSFSANLVRTSCL